MNNRPTHCTEYLRHSFSVEERLQMATELAEAHNKVAEIEEEEASVKAQIKERKTSVEQSIGRFSRMLTAGFEMRNIRCRLEWDVPNPFEVSYVREDTGETIKVRPQTETERQMDLPLAELKTEAEAEASAEKSAENIGEFFGRNGDGDEEEAEPESDEEPGEGDEDDEEAEFATAAAPAKKTGPSELKESHEKEVEKESKKGRKKAPAEPF